MILHHCPKCLGHFSMVLLSQGMQRISILLLSSAPVRSAPFSSRSRTMLTASHRHARSNGLKPVPMLGCVAANCTDEQIWNEFPIETGDSNRQDQVLLSRHFASAAVSQPRFKGIGSEWSILFDYEFPNQFLTPDFRQSFRRRYLTASSCSVMTAACSGRQPSLVSVSSISSPSLLRYR